MRIDKFLKNARIIKRRTIAKEACDSGRVRLNGNVAKAGSEVNVGDIIRVHFGESVLTFEVLDTKENVRKEQAQDLYRLLEGDPDA